MAYEIKGRLSVGQLLSLPRLTTVERVALGLTLAAIDNGLTSMGHRLKCSVHLERCVGVRFYRRLGDNHRGPSTWGSCSEVRC